MESTMEYYSGGFEDNGDPYYELDDNFVDDEDDSAAETFLEELKDDYADDLLKKKQRNYKILNNKEIRQRMEQDVLEVSTVLSISKVEASILLRHYNWYVSKVNDAWFADESGVREKVGLLGKPLMAADGVCSHEIVCGICFESYIDDRLINSAACGHPYCNTCWSSYISTSITNDGFGCLLLRCPEPSCRAAVGQDIIELLASEEDRKKYSDFLFKSYIEENRMTKWCPGPDCEYAVEFYGGDGSFGVTCHCFTSFCWNCNEESHRPVDCDTVNKWILKNSSESEDVNYILAYCKPCPTCKRPIEKNDGCMHMTCRVCCHEFCWLCLGPWTGHINCNRYEERNDKEDGRKKLAKENLEKYIRYFEHWDANKKSKVKALEYYQRVKDEEFKKLSELQGIPEVHLDFITKAWQQVVECRQILEWSYAYGYYLPDNELKKKQFFEYLQGEAETTLEKLHNCAEREMKQFLDADGQSNNFNQFQIKLVELTAVAGNHFEKLVRALENGLSDVCSYEAYSSMKEIDSYWHCDRCADANHWSVTECQMCFAPNCSFLSDEIM